MRRANSAGFVSQLLILILAVALVLLATQPCPAMTDQEYSDAFIAYFASAPPTVPTLEQYATQATYDASVNAEVMEKWLFRINDEQNSIAHMPGAQRMFNVRSM